jgi:hypothetical protein
VRHSYRLFVAKCLFVALLLGWGQLGRDKPTSVKLVWIVGAVVLFFYIYVCQKRSSRLGADVAPKIL